MMEPHLDKPVDMMLGNMYHPYHVDPHAPKTTYCYGEPLNLAGLVPIAEMCSVEKMLHHLRAYMTLRFKAVDGGLCLSVCFNFRLRGGTTFSQALMDCEALLQGVVRSLPKSCFLHDFEDEQCKDQDHGAKICNQWRGLVTRDNFYAFIARRSPLAVFRQENTCDSDNHHPWVTIGRLGPNPTWGDVDKLCRGWLAGYPVAAEIVSRGICELSLLQAEEEQQLARPADGPESRKRPEPEADENGSNGSNENGSNENGSNGSKKRKASTTEEITADKTAAAQAGGGRNEQRIDRLKKQYAKLVTFAGEERLEKHHGTEAPDELRLDRMSTDKIGKISEAYSRAYEELYNQMVEEIMSVYEKIKRIGGDVEHPIDDLGIEGMTKGDELRRTVDKYRIIEQIYQVYKNIQNDQGDDAMEVEDPDEINLVEMEVNQLEDKLKEYDEAYDVLRGDGPQ